MSSRATSTELMTMTGVWNICREYIGPDGPIVKTRTSEQDGGGHAPYVFASSDNFIHTRFRGSCKALPKNGSRVGPGRRCRLTSRILPTKERSRQTRKARIQGEIWVCGTYISSTEGGRDSFGWERGDNGGVGLHVPSATKALVHTRQRMMRIAVGTKISTFDARSFDGDVP